MTHLYKAYQQMYHDLVTNHTDLLEDCEVVIDEEVVENALRYFEVAEFPLVYPAKSYAVAIVYATLLKETYDIDLYESLNDPELFLGQDQYFVTYNQARETYDAILSRLNEKSDWLTGGWAPKTVEYFHLECTPLGIERINEGSL